MGRVKNNDLRLCLRLVRWCLNHGFSLYVDLSCDENTVMTSCAVLLLPGNPRSEAESPLCQSTVPTLFEDTPW